MSNAAELVRDCLQSVLGVHLEMVTVPHGQPTPKTTGPTIIVQRGQWFGDPWSGSTADTSVTVKGLRHPTHGRELTLVLCYTEHDLSGQTDSWDLTLAGFKGQSAAVRDQLDPRDRVRNLNENMQYRWVIDGQEGCTPRRKSQSWPPKP